MKLVPQYADESAATSADCRRLRERLDIASRRQQLIGVKLATAELRDLSRTTARRDGSTVDERRIAQVHTKFEGFIETLYVNFTGQPVRRGDPLLGDLQSRSARHAERIDPRRTQSLRPRPHARRRRARAPAACGT